MSSTTPVESLPAAATAPRRRRALRLGPVARRRLVVWCPPLVVALLFLPFAINENSWWEWNNAYWFLERQAAYISAHGLPTLFLHHGHGVFYALPVYYGGFTFAVLAVPAIVFGAWPTFLAATAGAYVAGYFGIWWTARNLGVSRGLAVLPALSFTCAPYMIATFYGRGAWAEVVGVNAAAVMLGAITSLLLWPERSPRWAMAALVPATALVAGTHNLTLLMSAVFLPLIVLALLPVRPAGAGERHLLRQGRWVVGGVLLGAGLTAAWLLPNIWFGRDTAIGGAAFNQFMLDDYRAYSATDITLWPWPRMPDGKDGNYNYSQFSSLVAAWTLLATLVALVLRRTVERTLLSILALTTIATAIVVLMTHLSWWPHFPDTIRAIQMPVRLVPYVALAVACAAAVAIAALRPGRVRTGLLGLLTLLIVGQIAMAAHLAIVTPSNSISQLLAPKHDQVTVGTEPPAFATEGLIVQIQFLVGGQATATATQPQPVGVQMRDGVTSVDGTMRSRGKVGDLALTSIDWSPYIKVDGDATIAGRDAFGMTIVRVDHVDERGDWNATVKPVCAGFCLEGLRGDAPWQLPVGRLISFLSALLFIGLVLVWSTQGVAGRLRARRARRSVAST